MNKKGQMYQSPEQSTPFSGAHPLLIFGIIFFILPYFNTILNWNIPGWFSGIGIFLILIGAGLSIVSGI